MTCDSLAQYYLIVIGTMVIGTTKPKSLSLHGIANTFFQLNSYMEVLTKVNHSH